MNYVFFIGGSGARAYTAFLHACAAGVVRTDQVNVMLLDADAKNAACESSISLFRTYQEHRNMLRRALPSSTAFHCEVRMLEETAVSPVHGDVVRLAQVDEGNDTRRRALKWFYSEDELDQDLSKGFYAHPNIGCVFFQNFGGNSSLDDCMENIVQDLNRRQETRVVIVGSVFGGTGAAGIPSVLKILKERCAEGQVPLESLHCCGVLITPYFSVAQASAGGGSLIINSDHFYGSTKAALPYYNLTEGFEQIYLVGQNNLDTVNNQYADGGKDQDNKPHIVEVSAALAVKDFLESTSKAKKLLGRFIDHGNEQVTWASLGTDMYNLADMLRAQMVLETMIYPCAAKPSQGGYQWRSVYRIDSAESQEQLGIMQKYGKSFFEWLYRLQSQYAGASGELRPDSAIKLCEPAVLAHLRGRAQTRIDKPEYKEKGGWRQYQQDFINLVETIEGIEYVAKGIGVLLSALNVLTKPVAALNAAGLFLKLFGLAGHAEADIQEE